MLQQQVEVNVGVENGAKKGQKGGDASKAGILARSLGGRALKESFSLNFESLFLDMFTSVPAPKIEKPVEAPRSNAIERPVAATSLTDVSRPARVEPSVNALADASRPAETTTRREASLEKREAEANSTRQIEDASDERQTSAIDEVKDVSDAVSKHEAVVTHVKIVKIELQAQLQHALSTSEINTFKEKLGELIKEKDLKPEDIYANALQLVAGLLHPAKAIDQPKLAEAAEIVPQAATDEGAAFKKFLKKFVVELKHALSDAKIADAATPEATVSPAIQEKVDETLSKLVAKMDRKLTAEDRRQVAEIVKRLESETARPAEVGVERPAEAPKAVAVRHESVRLATPEMKSDDGQKVSLRIDTANEAAAALDMGRAKGRAGNNAVTSAGGATTGAGAIEGASRSSRGPENQSQSFWQNSYNQNAANRGAERTNGTARNEAPRQAPPPPVFDQIVQSARIFLSEGKSEAVIKLNPEQLGKVEMKVTIEDGKVTVKFTAENQAVRAAIADNIQDLKRNLSELGLEVENVLVQLAGQFTNGENQEEERQQQAQPRRHGRLDTSFDDVLDSEDGVTPIAVADGSTVRYVA